MKMIRDTASILSVNERLFVWTIIFFSPAICVLAFCLLIDARLKRGPSGDLSVFTSLILLIANTTANSAIVAITKNNEVIKKPLKAFNVAPDGLLD